MNIQFKSLRILDHLTEQIITWINYTLSSVIQKKILKMLSTKFSLTRAFLNSRILSQLYSTYKSSISLDKLYPSSNLDLTAKLSKFTNDNDEQFSGYIPIGFMIKKNFLYNNPSELFLSQDKLQISNKLSSKPGGQHVNKSKFK